MSSFVTHCEQDGDDLVIVLPPELMAAAQFKVGDVVIWIDNGNGTFKVRLQHLYDPKVDGPAAGESEIVTFSPEHKRRALSLIDPE